ncbi:MAG: UbiX family flavin prenyltransferase [Candidatus Contubernalis sp.]|nr:UbiX family flavin prenyltransferase [Candidatus Contubernalis sp.]
MKKIIVGITGASGIDYARILVRELYRKDYTIYLIITEPGKIVMDKESDLKLTGDVQEQERKLKNFFEIPLKEDRRFFLLDNEDIAASVASGSFIVEAMVVIPCSMATVSSIARGSSQNLLERAADVMIKEGRSLIVVPRETPLSSIHLENLLALSRAGVTVLPAMPAFYHNPCSVEDLVKFVAGRVLEHLRLEHDLYQAWSPERIKVGRGRESSYKIGILQLTSHLDDTVEGFKEGLSTLKNVEFVYDYRNVEGKVPQMAQEAEDLVGRGMDLIFACTTPAAKFAAGAAVSKGTPVVFTPVLDPVKVGLVASWESSENNLTGVSGLVSSEQKLARFKEIYPSLRKLVVVYEGENPNAAIELEYVLKAAARMRLAVQTVEVTGVEDIRALAKSKFSSGTGFFVPVSPLVEQNITLLIRLAGEQKLPLMAPNEAAVKQGALLGLVAAHYDLGVEAGKMAAEILQGKDPADIPVGRPEQPDLMINLTAALNLKLEIPAHILEQASILY